MQVVAPAAQSALRSRRRRAPSAGPPHPIKNRTNTTKGSVRCPTKNFHSPGSTPHSIGSSLTDDQAHRIRCAFSRRRDLRGLASDALFYSLVLNGRSPRIDEAARAEIRNYLDVTRLLIAALPAREEDLNLKLVALTPPDPLVAEHVNLRAMLEAGARADIQRLKLPNPPRWI